MFCVAKLQVKTYLFMAHNHYCHNIDSVTLLTKNVIALIFIAPKTTESIQTQLPSATMNLCLCSKQLFPLSVITHLLTNIIYYRCQCCPIFYFSIFLL